MVIYSTVGILYCDKCVFKDITQKMPITFSGLSRHIIVDVNFRRLLRDDGAYWPMYIHLDNMILLVGVFISICFDWIHLFMHAFLSFYLSIHSLNIEKLLPCSSRFIDKEIWYLLCCQRKRKSMKLCLRWTSNILSQCLCTYIKIEDVRYQIIGNGVEKNHSFLSSLC